VVEEAAAGAAPCVELFVLAVVPAFFFVFAPGALCAIAIEPVTRKALTQKLAANFKYLFIGVLFPKQRLDFFAPPVQPPRTVRSIQLPHHRRAGVAALNLL
jgi:hypothetical protein